MAAAALTDTPVTVVPAATLIEALAPTTCPAALTTSTLYVPAWSPVKLNAPAVVLLVLPPSEPVVKLRNCTVTFTSVCPAEFVAVPAIEAACACAAAARAVNGVAANETASTTNTSRCIRDS
jgi:hypothetical protein